MHAVLGVLLALGERRQGLTEFDDVAVAILPIIEKGEVVGDVGKGLRMGHEG